MENTYYNKLAHRLIELIGERHYFNGTAEIETEEFCGILTATLIIYRNPLLDPADISGTATHITDIIPVWWKFDTYGPGGPCPNDFSWSEFHPFLIAAL